MLYTRDLNGRITTIKDTIGRTMRYAYDANGNRKRSTDPDGRITDYTYDSKWNTITSVTRHMDNGDKVTRTMEYDPQQITGSTIEIPIPDRNDSNPTRSWLSRDLARGYRA